MSHKDCCSCKSIGFAEESNFVSVYVKNQYATDNEHNESTGFISSAFAKYIAPTESIWLFPTYSSLNIYSRWWVSLWNEEIVLLYSFVLQLPYIVLLQNQFGFPQDIVLLVPIIKHGSGDLINNIRFNCLSVYDKRWA